VKAKIQNRLRPMSLSSSVSATPTQLKKRNDRALEARLAAREAAASTDQRVVRAADGWRIEQGGQFPRRSPECWETRTDAVAAITAGYSFEPIAIVEVWPRIDDVNYDVRSVGTCTLCLVRGLTDVPATQRVYIRFSATTRGSIDVCSRTAHELAVEIGKHVTTESDGVRSWSDPVDEKKVNDLQNNY
jgi:hypothetical protein